MTDDRVQDITDLLSQAGLAHHVYERTVLKGIDDQEWPVWYAQWMIEHGFNEVMGQWGNL